MARTSRVSAPHQPLCSPVPDAACLCPFRAAVDGVLLYALSRAGLLHPAHHGDFAALRWTRASRTDKGVHALAYVVTVKVRTNVLDHACATRRHPSHAFHAGALPS